MPFTMMTINAVTLERFMQSDNDDGADVYETQVPGGWLAELFGTKRVFGFCT